MATTRTQSIEGRDPWAAPPADPLGDDNILSLGAGDTAPPPAGQQAGTPKAPGTVELTAVGSFPNPWTGNPALEAQLATGKANGKWSPGTDTLAAAASAEPRGSGMVKTCANLDELLGFVIGASGAVARLNILTHGQSGAIGMAGEIKAVGNRDAKAPNDPEKNWVIGDVFFTRAAFVDQAAVTRQDAALVARRDAARAKFGAGARVVLYACDSGSSDVFVKALAGFFGATIGAFRNSIGYFPTIAGGVISNRAVTGVLGADGKIDPLSTIQAAGFKHMDGHSEFFTVNP
jgi:hypothetical protein